MTMRFEPQLPFVYLPSSLWADLADRVNKKYAAIYVDPPCSLEAKVCFFKTTCDKVQDFTTFSSFRLNDKLGGYYTFSMDSSYMRVSGDKVNLEKDYCYIPLFDHGLSGSKDS